LIVVSGDLNGINSALTTVLGAAGETHGTGAETIIEPVVPVVLLEESLMIGVCAVGGTLIVNLKAD
jgi:hypothetical protein